MGDVEAWSWSTHSYELVFSAHLNKADWTSYLFSFVQTCIKQSAEWEIL